jgi:hypothetical protein
MVVPNTDFQKYRLKPYECRPRERQRHAEPRAVFEAALDVDATFVRAYEFAHDRESDPGAAGRA